MGVCRGELKNRWDTCGHSYGVGRGWRGWKDAVFGQKRDLKILLKLCELTDLLGGGINKSKKCLKRESAVEGQCHLCYLK